MAKKQRKNKDKKEKARQFNSQHDKRQQLIDNTVANLPFEPLISEIQAINPTIQEKIENSDNIILNFDNYKESLCQIHSLQKSQAKTLIEKFQEITAQTPMSFPNSGIIRTKINRLDEYKDLYKGLPADIDILETEINNNGRIFFHLIDKYCCIVSIESRHRNLDK